MRKELSFIVALLLISIVDVQAQTDYTSKIINPSFEKGNLTGWTATGLGVQNNNVFSIKQGTWYAEKWTSRGGAVGDAYLSQHISGLPVGRYQLTVSAQNIQEDTPSTKQKGAWIFAGTHTEEVNVRSNYTITFNQVSDELDLGFEAKGATGNWIAVDNFRIEYLGVDFDAAKAEMAALVAKAESKTDERMNSEALQDLQTAIDAASPLLTQDNTDGWGAAARALETAYANAAASADVFARLTAAIAAARDELSASSSVQKDDYQTAVDVAQAIYDNPATTDEQAETAIVLLAEASFTFRVHNGSGTPPTVQTDPRFLRGCTWAFGRSSVTGSDIIEEGFCWSENPDPKVTDYRTTEYLNQAGKIYWIRDLKPATVYYLRAYAINKSYAVGYGDVIKVVTIPKGTITHWYNNGGDAATNERLNNAINTSIDYYWNNLTSIHGFGISVNYSPGTPTADCSYGGWMRVGENTSYQAPGTIMHEAFHGIGVGTHDMWWNSEMRSAGNRGDWLGDRVTEAVRFWDNSTTAVITGDDTHLWPYGCNGAHEDTHSDNLYCMMGILAQALNEDGLPGSSEIGYALPYYSFNHEDGVKYYIKNEDEKRGLRSAYLVETDMHTLEWKTMDAEEAVADDAAAWYLSFTPDNQYYQLRNVSTGYYMTYASGFKTVKHASPMTADNFHLMRGRVDVNGHRGYYIIHPEKSANPFTLIANANGKTGTTAWNIAKSATMQRWLILTAEEAESFENGNLDASLAELKKVLAQIRLLAQTPHTEVVEGTDESLAQALAAIEEEAKTCTKGKEVDVLTEQARMESMKFLSNVSASDVEHPFDLTFMLNNPDFDNDATTGWTSTNGAPGYGAQAAEFYEKTFDFYQTFTQMPAGVYQLRANAFQRPGSKETVFAPYQTGTAVVTTSLYINSTASPVSHICDDRQPSALYNDGDWGSDYRVSDGNYIPNCMTGASRYFAKGLYDSSVAAEATTVGNSLRVGIKCTKASSSYWTMFDHFRLFFFGQNRTVMGIVSIENGKLKADNPNDAVYDLQGRRVASSNSQLKKGIYIVNGKKVVR